MLFNKIVTSNILSHILISLFKQVNSMDFYVYSGISKHAAYGSGGKVFKTSFKIKIVVSNGQLLDGMLDSGSTRASKGRGRTPVWKAVEEELPTGYLNQTLKQKGFYLFNTSKITLSTVLTKSL